MRGRADGLRATDRPPRRRSQLGSPGGRHQYLLYEQRPARSAGGDLHSGDGWRGRRRTEAAARLARRRRPPGGAAGGSDTQDGQTTGDRRPARTTEHGPAEPRPRSAAPHPQTASPGRAASAAGRRLAPGATLEPVQTGISG